MLFNSSGNCNIVVIYEYLSVGGNPARYSLHVPYKASRNSEGVTSGKPSAYIHRFPLLLYIYPPRGTLNAPEGENSV